MEGMTITPLIFFVTNAMLLVLGYLIKYQRKMSLIAGYDPERVTDERGLANWVGGGLLLIGGIGVAVGLLMVVVPEDYMLLLVLPFGVGIVIGSIVLAVGCGKYMRRGGGPGRRKRAA